MTKADDLAERIRDQAVAVVLARGAITVAAPEQRSFQDKRLRIDFWPCQPHAIDIYKIGDGERKVFGAIWNPDVGDVFVVLIAGGSWQDYLVRVAKACG